MTLSISDYQSKSPHGCSTSSPTARYCSTLSTSSRSVRTARTRSAVVSWIGMWTGEAGHVSAEDLSDQVRLHSRSVLVGSDGLGTMAQIDLIETDEGRVMPVDYKRRKPPDVVEGALGTGARRQRRLKNVRALYRCLSSRTPLATSNPLIKKR